MTNLYTQSDLNIRKTWAYLSFFILLVAGIGWTISYFADSPIIFWIALIIAFSMSFFSYWFSDKMVLSMFKAKPVTREEMPELFNIVQNLSITAGLPMPQLYITEESQPNAFATGRNPDNAAIVVTRGLVNLLERVELEGVLAHELAHIGNRDILLSTIVVVLVGTISILTDTFFRASLGSRDRGGDGDEAKGRVLMMIVAVLLMILAPLVAQLIKLAISRKREYLADSTGSLLTRYPEGLARALEKISRDQTPMTKANTATAHLFINNPLKEGRINNLFSTHPPIENRIAKLRGL